MAALLRKKKGKAPATSSSEAPLFKTMKLNKGKVREEENETDGEETEDEEPLTVATAYHLHLRSSPSPYRRRSSSLTVPLTFAHLPSRLTSPSHTNTHHNSPPPAVTNTDRHRKTRHQLTLGLSLTAIDYLTTNPSLHRYNLGFTPSCRLCVPHPPSQLVVGICAPSPSSVFESLIRGSSSLAVRGCSSSRPCSLAYPSSSRAIEDRRKLGRSCKKRNMGGDWY
ncbi:hypothetical protein PIB30_090463 [Stylosanthes scabra]|uniref:Uncharacterized protein n=1 Tax=Stylosanthes scabra TaxID=79078 RepID=A0ABU6TTZ7_9FABA|nr:hypothetical protein [Stylosanthes scabra]